MTVLLEGIVTGHVHRFGESWLQYFMTFYFLTFTFFRFLSACRGSPQPGSKISGRNVLMTAQSKGTLHSDSGKVGKRAEKLSEFQLLYIFNFHGLSKDLGHENTLEVDR